MEHSELRYWVALNLLNPIIGASRANQLLQEFQQPEAIFEAGSVTWQSLGLSELACQALARPDWQKVDEALHWAEQANHGLVIQGMHDYPANLLEISDAPILLYYQGDVALLDKQQLALVGSRNPTPAGYETAFELAAESARLGFVISSGMAMGIDSAAHRGALSAKGMTIAVAGTGLDNIYPSKNKDLAEEIRQQGLLISEFPLGTKPLGRNFPLRNRIISGLSRGVIVVEAALKSGSLITAKQALDQSRDVFAVPGSIHNPTSRGCHWLLRQGAKLVENIGDILEEFDLRFSQMSLDFAEDHQLEPRLQLDDIHNQVLSAIDFAPTTVDHIIQRCGLTADLVCSMLLVLELQGYAHMTSAGQYAKARPVNHNEGERVEESVCGISYV